MSAETRKVVVLVASHDTNNGMRSWAERQGFDLGTDYDGNPRPADKFDFHITLVASANAVFVPETQHMIEPVDARAIGFDVLGKDREVPVLKLEPSAALVAMREFFIETYGIEPTFADYKPHVSLSYAWDGQPAVEDLDLPDVPLVFDQLRVKSLDAVKEAPAMRKSDADTLRRRAEQVIAGVSGSSMSDDLVGAMDALYELQDDAANLAGDGAQELWEFLNDQIEALAERAAGNKSAGAHRLYR